MRLTWDDTEDIGIALFEKYRDQDPLGLSFTRLHAMVLDLDDFDDDPAGSSEGKLETIQMAWYDEAQDA